MSRDPFSPEPWDRQERETAWPHNARSHQADPVSQAPATHVLAQADWRNSDRPPSLARKPEQLDSAQVRYLGGRTYFVRDSELQTMTEIGTFRAIADTDLAQLGYGGDSKRMEREIRRLLQQSLLSERLVPSGRNLALRLLVLTKAGARLVRGSGSVAEDQAIYHGFARPREAKHDADLYRIYHAQAQAILRSGGRPTRVLLDYELLSDLNRDLAALSGKDETGIARQEIAERHGLAMVDGKIPLPDLRVEYDTAEMEHQHLDLELATRNYGPDALAEKAKAGFSLYARSEDAARLRRVLRKREISAEIFAL